MRIRFPNLPRRLEALFHYVTAERSLGFASWVALLLVTFVGLPLFLCMPLAFDTVHYDLCARTLIRGGALYRDVADNNLPGVIWIHAGIRTLLGWRSEALRFADFGFMTV